MTNFLKFDINEHLKTKYPKLTEEHIDLIASDVKQRWDYRELIDSVDFKCKQTAYYANIELRPPFNTETVADISDNEPEGISDESDYEPMEHTSEGC